MLRTTTSSITLAYNVRKEIPPPSIAQVSISQLHAPPAAQVRSRRTLTTLHQHSFSLLSI